MGCIKERDGYLSNGFKSTKKLCDLNKIRHIVVSSLGNNFVKNAVFFANKLVTLSNGLDKDIYLLAQAYYQDKQFLRAIHLIQQSGFLGKYSLQDNLKENDGRRKSQNESNMSCYKEIPDLQSPILFSEIKDDDCNENIEFILLIIQCLIESKQYDDAQLCLKMFSES